MADSGAVDSSRVQEALLKGSAQVYIRTKGRQPTTVEKGVKRGARVTLLPLGFGEFVGVGVGRVVVVTS